MKINKNIKFKKINIQVQLVKHERNISFLINYYLRW